MASIKGKMSLFSIGVCVAFIYIWLYKWLKVLSAYDNVLLFVTLWAIHFLFKMILLLEQGHCLSACIVLFSLSNSFQISFMGCYSVSKEPWLTSVQCVFVLLWVEGCKAEVTASQADLTLALLCFFDRTSVSITDLVLFCGAWYPAGPWASSGDTCVCACACVCVCVCVCVCSVRHSIIAWR